MLKRKGDAIAFRRAILAPSIPAIPVLEMPAKFVPTLRGLAARVAEPALQDLERQRIPWRKGVMSQRRRWLIFKEREFFPHDVILFLIAWCPEAVSFKKWLKSDCPCGSGKKFKKCCR